ncbi:lactate utilization protein [Candidatus Falkowbacteria bacterium]|nr:lactate utilization protein [Candidatus Falkowbacteria bacterium]
MQKEFLPKETKENIWKVVFEYKAKREKTLAGLGLDPEKFRDEFRKMKEDAFRDMENLRRRAIANLEKNVIKVFEARDVAEAQKILRDLTSADKLVVKAKTSAADEIGVDDVLKEKLVSTDLGDFIMSLAGARDMHPVFPSYHLTPKQISEIIKNKFGSEVAPDAKSIAAFARKYLREKFFEASTGISGANVITADGRIVLLENEGNISLISRVPDKHIIISGWEKIVPTVEDAMKVVRAAAVWGAGQDWPVYVSVISGPSKTADVQNELVIGAQGAKEVYLILLDNGRSKMLKDGPSTTLGTGFEELLYCINCGACLNFCPAYHQLGTKYGDKYLGSKGIILSAFMTEILRAKESGCYSCTLCSACAENCPAKIDLPGMMKKIRTKLNAKNLETDENKKMIGNTREFGNPFGELSEDGTPKELFCC